MAETRSFFDVKNLLIVEDLPTLGYPVKPTVTVCLGRTSFITFKT